MNKKKTKIIVILCIFIALFIMSIAIIININKKENETENRDDKSKKNENIIITDNLTDFDDKEIKESQWKKIDDEYYETNNTEKSNQLEEVDNSYTYFLIKQCIETYYNVSTPQDALNLINENAKESMKINLSNVGILYRGIRFPEFRIDEILKQNIDENKDIYVVYYKLKQNTENNELAIDEVIFIEIDKYNKTFNIYPNEYLNINNYLNLKSGDQVVIYNRNTNQGNMGEEYTIPSNSSDEKRIIEELFNRYKFDVKYDVDGLYNKIPEEYRDKKFQEFNNFYTYIEETRTQIIEDTLEEYDISDFDEYKEYVAKGKNQNIYIFDVVNLMNYTLRFDDYTVLTEKQSEIYNEMSLPNKQAKYCIDRVIRAINNKDYDFVYNNLNPVLKSNYYSNIDDFKNFIQSHFWEENEYNILQMYMISQNVFQYEISITDKAGALGYRLLTATVTLKDKENFDIALKMK